ncbi:MAG: ribosome silencing factor [Candidatus Omnitrophica bacterium]|nr:ribosome silencing factor [Candidatus Omnitrophota bacterium]
MKSREKALLVAELARSKKAQGLVILDMKKLSNITDYFIIATSASTRRSQTIAETIEEGLLKAREPVSSIEGRQDGEWILIDAYDVVTHIFKSEVRDFYNLESLWSDAPRVRICRRSQKKKRKPSKKSSKKR